MDQDTELKLLLSSYASLHFEFEAAKKALDDTRAKIAKRVLELGEPVAYGRVSATIRAGYTKVTWDSKALEGFAAAHPEVLRLRRESEVKPSVTIKVSKEEEA